ncbi:hypothetical protein EON62_01000, partial [archaeon]
NIEALDLEGDTPLRVACQCGHAACVRVLVTAGAELEKTWKNGETSLHATCSNARDACTQVLLDAGANKDAVDTFGDTPLHKACMKGSAACVRVLLAAGANKDAVERDGATPLHIACQEGWEECVRALLEAGASQHAVNGSGATPLFLACEKNHIACTRALLGAGAPLEVANESGATALLVACWNGFEACARALLDAGANKEAANQDGATPLYVACQKGHAACVHALLEAGANMEATNRYGATAMHAACGHGHTAIVRMLLERGASHASDSFFGMTPLALARTKSHAHIVEMLEEVEARDAAAAVASSAAAAAAAAIVCEVNFEDLTFDCEADGGCIELGRGSFGRVYAGRWRGERVAIKLTSLPTAPATREHFWREVHLHMQANYKHVVRVYGAALQPAPHDAAEVHCYMVMSRLAADLSSLLHTAFDEHHPLSALAASVRPLPQRLRLLLEIVRGLRYLHACNIVHADLKPGNVMVDERGHAQLTDFGVSVQRAPVDVVSGGAAACHAGLRGSPAYMDPALALHPGASVTPASDMYSWGVLAWEVLTLRKPFNCLARDEAGAGAGAGATASADAAIIRSFAAARIGGERPAGALARVVPELPNELHELVVRCWNMAPVARPTAVHAISVLEAALTRLTFAA